MDSLKEWGESQEPRIRELAQKLGGGWRLEHGIMPVVVLTIVEAEALEARLERTSSA